MSTKCPVALTEQQKLQALALRFYQGLKWVPEAGHHYTTSRNDLELYRIAKIEDGKVYTEYCHLVGVYSEWPVEEFTSEGFGVHRVWVPPFVLGLN